MPHPTRLRPLRLEDRLTPAADGTPDEAFGPAGSRFVTLDPAKSDEFTGLTVAPDGKPVMTAAVTTVTQVPGPHGLPSFLFDYDLSVVRTLPDGTPDPTFGTGGRAAIPPFTTTRDWEAPSGARGEVAVGSGGAVVAVFPRLNDGGVVYRLTPDGQVDAAFGSGGRVLVPWAADAPGGSIPYRLAVLADGSVLVAAVYQEWVDVTRLTPAGMTDPAFGTGGTARTSSGPAGPVTGSRGTSW